MKKQYVNLLHFSSKFVLEFVYKSLFALICNSCCTHFNSLICFYLDHLILSFNIVRLLIVNFVDA